MRIRLEHTSNPLNYGTNMMVTNFMYYLDKKIGKENTYLLDVVSDADLEKYKIQYKNSKMKKQLIDYDFTYADNIGKRVFNKIKRDYINKYATYKLIKKTCSKFDKLVILGGDDLSEYYDMEALKKEFYRLNILKEKCQTFLVGQTIGPFYNERLKLAKECFKEIEIYSRDPWTTRYLKENMQLSSVYDCSDLAFLSLPDQENEKIEENILLKYNLHKNKYITLVPSGLYKSYCPDKDKYIENWINIIKYIKNEFSDVQILLLPHVLRHEKVDDRNIIKEIQNILGRDRITYIYDEILPLEARFLLGNGIFTITGRMHGAISTLQMRKPAISISYSIKYKGVIGQGLGLDDLVIEADDRVSWETLKISKITEEKINYVMGSYKEIIENIDKGVSNAEQKALRMIEDISNKIKG